MNPDPSLTQQSWFYRRRILIISLIAVGICGWLGYHTVKKVRMAALRSRSQ